jgi:AcrR family transcriptional regulator
MKKNNFVKFSEAKQFRSEKTLNDLLEAADELVTAADPKKFTARSLAQKSGYALGTLSTRLQSVENVFLWVIEKQRDQHIQAIVKIVEEFDQEKPIQALGDLLLDKAFETFKKVNPKVIQYVESRLIKRDQFSSKYFHFLDPLADALFKHSKKNTSNTFRETTENEAKLMVRSFIMIVERPFAEEDPIAGSKEHRRITLQSFVRLFGN